MKLERIKGNKLKQTIYDQRWAANGQRPRPTSTPPVRITEEELDEAEVDDAQWNTANYKKRDFSGTQLAANGQRTHIGEEELDEAEVDDAELDTANSGNSKKPYLSGAQFAANGQRHIGEEELDVAEVDEADIDGFRVTKYELDESSSPDFLSKGKDVLDKVTNFFTQGHAANFVNALTNLIKSTGAGSKDEAEVDSAEVIALPHETHPDNLSALQTLASHLLFSVDCKLLKNPEDSDEAETAFLKKDYSSFEWAMLAKAAADADIQKLESSIHSAWVNGDKSALTSLKVALHEILARIAVAELHNKN